MMLLDQGLSPQQSMELSEYFSGIKAFLCASDPKKSQNPTMIWVGRDLKNHAVQITSMGRDATHSGQFLAPLCTTVCFG